MDTPSEHQHSCNPRQQKSTTPQTQRPPASTARNQGSDRFGKASRAVGTGGQPCLPWLPVHKVLLNRRQGTHRGRRKTIHPADGHRTAFHYDKRIPVDLLDRTTGPHIMGFTPPVPIRNAVEPLVRLGRRCGGWFSAPRKVQAPRRPFHTTITAGTN